MISNTEKAFLIISIFLAWGLGFEIRILFAGNFSLQALIGLVFGASLLWLAPFALLSLFSDTIWVLLAAFILGSLGFFLVAFNWYMGVGLFALFTGFAYWMFSVRYGRSAALSFSIMQMLQGIGFFFTMLAVFGSFLYYYSPFSSREKFNPVIPERFFDIIYHPISELLISQLPALPHSQAVDPEVLKPQIYRVVNSALAEIAKKYQEYIPFAFAAAVFFALRAIFYPLKYLLFGFTFLVVTFFLKIGLLKKEKVQTEKEIVRF